MKKTYLKPETTSMMVKLTKMMVTSDPKVIKTEVSASEAGSRRGSIWDDDDCEE